ncbi:hypothetical protein D3C75_1367240 [compost metagenome]
MIVMHRAAIELTGAVAQSEVAARHFVQHPGEVFTAHGLESDCVHDIGTAQR